MASERISVLRLIRDSVAAPGVTAERLLSLELPLGTVVQGAILVSALDALLLGLLGGGAFAVPTPDGDLVFPPMIHALLLLASLLLSAGALQVGGQIVGGQGRFHQALLLVVWLEVVALAVQVIQLAVALLVTPLAPFVGLAGLAVLLWCMIHFTRVLHRFEGYGRTILALIFSTVVILIALSLLLGFLGMGAPPNV